MGGEEFEPVPAPRVDEVVPYRSTRPTTGMRLYLDGNEGSAPPADLLAAVAGRIGDLLSRYPDERPLLDAVCARHGVEASRVVLTAGVLGRDRLP